MPSTCCPRFATSASPASGPSASGCARLISQLVQAGALLGSLSTDDPEVATGLIFALAESVITLRWENDQPRSHGLGDAIATGSLRLVHVRNARIPAIARAAATPVQEAGSGVEAPGDRG